MRSRLARWLRSCRRYSTDTVGKIIEALYCAYALTYDGQFGYIVDRNRGKKLSQETFDGRVEIGRNPGLSAVLAEDVSVEVVSTGGALRVTMSPGISSNEMPFSLSKCSLRWRFTIGKNGLIPQLQ